MILDLSTPPTSVVDAPPQTRGTPESHDESALWDTMLTRLALDRAQHLLEGAVETLEQLTPVADGPADTALRHLRSALHVLR